MNRIIRLLTDVGVFILIAIILYLFYRSLFVLIPAIPLFILYKKYSAKNAKKKRREELGNQFKDFLLALSAALRAGYSVENALPECAAEMKMMYGEEGLIYKETLIMINQIKLSMPTEKVIDDLAKRSGVTEIELFASVFHIAKRSGGDIVEIIQTTAEDIASKIETKKEVEVVMASKKFEQKIMNAVPMGIIVYISLSSKTLLDPLYGNALGITIMTICLLLYAFAFFLSQKIMDIKV